MVDPKPSANDAEQAPMYGAETTSRSRWYLPNDWFGGGIPSNVEFGPDVYIDTSYGFAPFLSRHSPGLILGPACGAYERSTFVVGPEGRITVGAYTCLNGVYLICNELITIGAHCLLAWGVVIADTAVSAATPLAARRAALRAASTHPDRFLPPADRPRPVVIEDNVWIGFDSVVMPEVRIGRGAVIGCKTVISEDVAPYTVVAGCPPRVIRTLDPKGKA